MYSIADDYNCRQAHRLHEAATRLQAEIEWQVSSYCFLILISGYKLTAYICSITAYTLQHCCIPFAVTLQSNCSSAAKGMQYHCKIVALICSGYALIIRLLHFERNYTTDVGRRSANVCLELARFVLPGCGSLIVELQIIRSKGESHVLLLSRRQSDLCKMLQLLYRTKHTAFIIAYIKLYNLFPATLPVFFTATVSVSVPSAAMTLAEATGLPYVKVV